VILLLLLFYYEALIHYVTIILRLRYNYGRYCILMLPHNLHTQRRGVVCCSSCVLLRIPTLYKHFHILFPPVLIQQGVGFLSRRRLSCFHNQLGITDRRYIARKLLTDSDRYLYLGY
jgi:hypothetical protein